MIEYEVSVEIDHALADFETTTIMLTIDFSLPADNEDLHMATEQTTNWPDLAIGLYDRLTGRTAEISYEFADLHIKVPSGTGEHAEHAEWVLSGTMKIRTSDQGQLPN